MGYMRDMYDARVREETLRADPAQRAVMDQFDRLYDELSAQSSQKSGLLSLIGGLKKPEAVRGLYLWGGVGRGKSMMMDLFYEHAPVPAKRVHFHAFMQDIQARLHKARKDGVEDAIAPVISELASSVRLLCFDEMQITDIADAMIVGRLFEGLFAKGVTVVTTSNRIPDDLYKDGLNRQLFLPFIGLIKEQLEVYEIASPTDYRQGRLAGAPVYFSPAGRRDVALPQFQNGIARAGFWDICGQLYGPADFLAIADAVKVLILEDVPNLSRHNFNEAKRFVTLIDALYEARRRLIVTAAAEPEKLYVEGSGSFEFERTASRLREMQAEDWGLDA